MPQKVLGGLLVALAVTVIVAIAGFDGWELKRGRDAAVASAKRTATSLARAVAAYTELSFAAADAALVEVASHFSDRPPDGSEDPQGEAILLRQLRTAGQLRAVVVADEAGRVISSAGAPELDGADAAGRPWFVAARQRPESGLHVGDGERLWAFDRPLVPLSRAIVDASGRFRGVVAGMYRPEAIEPFLASLDVGRFGSATVLRTDGTVLARAGAGAPAMEFDPGSPATAQSWTYSSGGDRGAAVAVPVAGVPFQATVALSERDYLAPWRDSMVIDLLAVMLVTLLGVTFTALLLHALRQQSRALGALRLSEERFRDYAGAASDWFWEQDPEGRFTYVSRSISAVPGMSADAYIGRTLRETAPLGVSHSQWAMHDRALSAREPLRDFRFQRIDSDGRTRYVSINGRPYYDSAGRFAGFRGTAREITAEVEAEEGRRRAEAAFALALTNMTQGLCLYDAGGRLMLFNQRYLELFNLPPELIRIGMPLRDVLEVSVAVGNFLEEEADEVIGKRLALSASRGRGVLQERLTCGRVIEIMQQPLADGGTVATYTDVTEREVATEALRTAKEQAEAASHAKSAFLANMSHELRTPLNAIMGFSDVMGSEVFGRLGSPRYVQYARLINQSGSHLLQLINDVLDMSKIEAGRYELEREEIDLHATVELCLSIVRGRADEAHIRIKNKVPRDLPRLSADTRVLRQILLNLLSNAIKFTPPGGRVAVKAERGADGALIVRVRDSGIGIAADALARVFEPFQQADPAVSRRFGGTGLGLSISRRFMELHGGRITLVSREGSGTSAILWFPPTAVGALRNEVAPAAA